MKECVAAGLAGTCGRTLYRWCRPVRGGSPASPSASHAISRSTSSSTARSKTLLCPGCTAAAAPGAPAPAGGLGAVAGRPPGSDLESCGGARAAARVRSAVDGRGGAPGGSGRACSWKCPAAPERHSTRASPPPKRLESLVNKQEAGRQQDAAPHIGERHTLQTSAPGTKFLEGDTTKGFAPALCGNSNA